MIIVVDITVYTRYANSIRSRIFLLSSGDFLLIEFSVGLPNVLIGWTLTTAGIDQFFTICI